MSAQGPVSKRDFTLQRDPWGQLVLVDGDGRRFVGVTPMRAFPLSDVDHWISICDASGHEMVCLLDWSEVAPEVRAILEEELSRRELIPVIVRIIAATTEEPSQWEVETDRGPSTFQINSEEDVRRLEPHQASILDSHGVRYLIRDVRRLDAASRRILDHFL
ncbi:MAG: DUF1854 domain-containing protein [Thermoguttaceae bacterium]